MGVAYHLTFPLMAIASSLVRDGLLYSGQDSNVAILTC